MYVAEPCGGKVETILAGDLLWKAFVPPCWRVPGEPGCRELIMRCARFGHGSITARKQTESLTRVLC
jgi:hypothetical protein